MATNQTISTALKTIKAAYPRFEVEADTVAVWASFLRDMSDDLLLAAVARFISSSDHAFPPSIPEIRTHGAELRREIAGIPSAFEAWDEVRRMPPPRDERLPLWVDGKRMPIEKPNWSHEIIGTVARRLGWPHGFPSENEVADRAHFVKAFNEEITRVMQAETQIPLVTEYIQQEKSRRLLDVSGEIKSLSSGMAKRKV